MSKAHDTKQMRAYLDALAAGELPLHARKAAKMARISACRFRRQYKWFREEEAKYLPEPVPGAEKQRDYFDLLYHHAGNELQARISAGITTEELARWRTDPKFLVKEQEELEGIVAKAEEELTKLAIGRISKLKDANLTLKILGKWRPEKYGEKARVIEHHHLQGAALDDELDRLLRLGAPNEPDSAGD